VKALCTTLLVIIVHVDMQGKSAFDKARVDMIADSVEDYIVKPCVYIRREQNAEEKVNLRTLHCSIAIFKVYYSSNDSFSLVLHIFVHFK